MTNALTKFEDTDKSIATALLLETLEEGEKSARDKGWLSSGDVEAALGL